MYRRKTTLLLLGIFIMLALPCKILAQNEDKVAVLITSWCSPRGFDFGYAWRSHSQCRVGDRTEYEGQPCKIGHVGEFPYQTHLGLIPWFLAWETPGFEHVYDNSGIYQLVGETYVHIHPDGDSILAASIPPEIPITPAVELEDTMNGGLLYPPDPRDGTDHLAGWYKLGSSDSPFPNGWGDLYERGPLGNMRYRYIINVMGNPPSESETVLEIEEYTWQMLENAFGDNIDIRKGCYDWVEGYTRWEGDVAEDFANEGFRKMLLARETTDNNNYANEYMTGNYVKESLCEIGVLDDMMIYHTRQVGRTPEFNAMNVMNMRPFIEAYPKGSTIGVLYVTRGLPWATESVDPSPFGRYHPWSKEVYHENAYLNYLSFKKAFIKAFGDDYNLVFNVGGTDSDLREDNFYSYSMDWNEPFNNPREAIQMAKAEGLDTLIVIPAHWQYDNNDTYLQTRLRNGLPLNPRSDLENDIFHLVYCEDAAGAEVNCDSPDAVAEITLAPAYSSMAEEFGVSYYVALRGTLERFGLFPKNVNIDIEASQMVTKLAGGTVEVTDPDSKIAGAKIEMPADPYPDWPESFTPSTAIPITDPADTNDCLWEDTVINIGHQKNAHGIPGVEPLGKAIHIGPYRTKFNRDVTITLPYTEEPVDPDNVSAYIFNELTQGWDSIEPESINTVDKLVTIKMQVSGLFQVGEKI